MASGQSRVTVALALCLLPLALTPAAQQQAPPPFRAGVEAFELEVTVLDRDRVPVRGLTQADFAILEGGRLQPIVAFSEVEYPGYDGPLTTAVEDNAPDVAAARYADRRLIAIILDDFGMPERPSDHMQMALEAKAIGKLLVDRLGVQDFAAVILTRDTSYIPDFTNNRWKLFGYVNAFNPPPAAERLYLSWVMRGRIGGLVALVDVAQYLAKLPQHRKAIYYVSLGQAVPPGSVARDRMIDAMRAAAEAGIPIYAIDPSGLTVGRSIGVDTLRTLADNTGGLAVVGTNDLRTRVLESLEETRSYYLIGYQHTGLNDGKFRRIEVRLKRPGLIALARTGRRTPGPPDIVKPPPRPIDEEVEVAVEDLGKGANRKLSAYAVARPDRLEIVGEIGIVEFNAPRWSAGAEVEALVTRGPGETIASTRGRIAAGERSVRLDVPLGQPPAASAQGGGPYHVSLRAIGSGATIEGGVDAAPDGILLGQPLVFRARSAASAVFHPAAEFQFSRTERLRAEFPVLRPLTERHVRLLRRQGDALMSEPQVVERQVDGRTTLSVDLSLSFLAPADYVFELFVRGGDAADRKLIAFKVR